MSTPEASGDQHPSPFPLGEYGFEHLADAAVLAASQFRLSPFSTLYYPGSSSDISLAHIPGVQTIHADLLLDPEAFAEIGSEAYQADVHEWSPPVQPDMVALINASGIDPQQALEVSGLREGGLVLWAGGVPSQLQESADTELLGVITYDDNGQPTVDTENLEDYFTIKPFESLTEAEQADFISHAVQCAQEVEAQTNLKGNELHRVTYESLRLPGNRVYLVNSGYNFMRSKTGGFFVYSRTSNPNA